MVKLIELFAGIGSQTAAFQKLEMEHELVGVAEIDKDAVVSYAASHCAYNEIHKSYKYPSAEVMAEYLETRNIGFDFKQGKPYDWRKHIDKKTGEARPELKKYYLASVLAKNFGDISKIERLGYADFWTYSFPCQDISVAGLQKGINKGTRSGLLYEVERLLEVANTHNELPKYLMLENVKNLVSKKFRKQFFEWIRRLEELGYNTYWQVLNAKDYGIPQNRERVFAISIRKDIDKGYQFPKPFDNGIRLKHILEDNVDEKYYINSEKVNKILNSGFHQERDIIQNEEICSTLLARDYKDPKCVAVDPRTNEQRRLGGLFDDGERHQAGSIWSTDHLAPTLDTMQAGWRQPCILAPRRTEYGKAMRKQYEAGEIKESRHNMNRLEPRLDGISNTLTTVQKDNLLIELQTIIAQGGRNSDDPSSEAKYEQKIEFNSQGTTNTLTSVQKDNLVLENFEPMGIYTGVSEKFQKGPIEGLSRCLKANAHDSSVIESKLRVRRLTPLECWILMGFTKEQFHRAEKVNSNTQLYKQAGNSIVVDVLYHIFRNLFTDVEEEYDVQLSML